LRHARGRVVTVLSGSETVERAYALGKLLRVGLGSHQAALPEEVSGALDAYRLPLSSIRDADVVVVLGDVPVVERAPVVDLWIKSARRNGARVLDDANDPTVAEAKRVVLVWSGPGGADLIVTGTGYLERDGTFVNLEGRLQRLRRTVEPPCPDELEWVSQLAARFDVDVPRYAAAVFAEVSERVYGGLPFGEVGERAPLRVYPEAQEHIAREALPEPALKVRRGEIRLVAYKPLFSGAAVERVAELQ